MQDHRQLRVWRHAHDLAIAVRHACKSFPRSGSASLHAQTTRSAESIVFNIVEGCGSASQRELARFIDVSIKSTSELESQLELARDYGIMLGPVWGEPSTGAINARRMLHGLRTKVLASLEDEKGAPKQPGKRHPTRTKERPRTQRSTKRRNVKHPADAGNTPRVTDTENAKQLTSQRSHTKQSTPNGPLKTP